MLDIKKICKEMFEEEKAMIELVKKYENNSSIAADNSIKSIATDLLHDTIIINNFYKNIELEE
jgi:hypothetical protein